MAKRATPTDGVAGGTGIPAGHSGAIRKLVGSPLGLADELPESPAAQLVVLYERLRELKYPPENPYRTNFALFHSTCCYTKDEARGRVQTIPDYGYLRQVEDALLRYSPLLIDKARRQLITWTLLAFDLWLIGGGTDPRWPELLPSESNPDGSFRKIIIAARKLEDENGSADFLERLGWMYQEFENRGCRKYWPDFPEIKFTYARATASNGGIISAVPQGKDQMAGSGVTFIHAEEFSRWSEQQASLGTALQTLAGGGHMALPCTAQAGTHAARIVLDQVRQS